MMMEKHNVRILVCTHKEGPVRDDDIYMPVQVGKSASTIDLGCQGDDVGDNISGKNKTYCELTGLYLGLEESERCRLYRVVSLPALF